MSDIKDWRGTVIRVGDKVITHGLGKFPVRALGIVTRASNGSVTVERTESDSTYRGKGKIVISGGSVTVLTPEMFDAKPDA